MVATVKVNASRVDAALRARALVMGRRAGKLLVDEARRGVSRRTGELAESIKADSPRVSGDRVVVHVHVDAEHGVYQEEGTGIYGPTGTPIRARSGGVLRFDWPAAGGIVFARSVRGSPPTKFWSKALRRWPQIIRRIAAGG